MTMLPKDVMVPFSSMWARFRFAPRARVERRAPCCIHATLSLLSEGYSLDGLILELGCQGLLFREASLFTLDRRGAPVSVNTDRGSFLGTIVTVRPEGYGIGLQSALSETSLMLMLAAHVPAHDFEHRSE